MVRATPLARPALTRGTSDDAALCQRGTCVRPRQPATRRRPFAGNQFFSSAMHDPHRPAPVDASVLRSTRQAESSPFEQSMIWLANTSVFLLVAAVLFFTVLARLPDRPRASQAAAPVKKAAAKGTGAVTRDGKYTAAQVAQHDKPVRGGGAAGIRQRAVCPARRGCSVVLGRWGTKEGQAPTAGTCYPHSRGAARLYVLVAACAGRPVDHHQGQGVRRHVIRG